MRKLLNERTGCLIAGQCEKEKAFGAASEGLFYSLCAAGLEVYQRIKSFHNAQGFTLKQPHDNVRYYSHSIVELNVADDFDALERVQRRLLAGGVRSSMRAFGLHDAHG